jgi:hypothetical protein
VGPAEVEDSGRGNKLVGRTKLMLDLNNRNVYILFKGAEFC